MRIRFHAFGFFLALLLAQAAHGTEWFVGIYNFYFSPTNLTVAPGDTVTWINMVNTSHDTTQYDPNNPDAGSLWTVDPFGRGESFSFTFNNAGNFPYVCAVHYFEHPEQTGLVVVAQMNLPPTVHITSPANNAPFTAPANFTFSADAGDIDGSIIKVELFVNGNSVGASAGPSISTNITGLAAGNYVLTAVATDNRGAATTSDAVNISVQGAPMQFALTASAQPQNGGSIALDPPQPNNGYNAGTVVTLTASSANGFAFSGWTGAITTSQNPITVTMDSAKNVTANFSPNITPSYTLTLSTNPPGSGAISNSIAPNGPNGTYLDGTTVILSALATPNFIFTNWSGDVSGTDREIVITIHSNTVVAANFVESAVRHFTLTVQAVPPDLGFVLVTLPFGFDGTYEEGTTVMMTAIPRGGSMFVGWSGDVSSTSTVATVVMNTNKIITATFARIPIAYTLTLGTNPPAAGAILVTPPPRVDGTYGGGATIALAAIPESGFRFVHWSGAVPFGATNNPLVIMTDTNPLAPVQTLNINANFEPITPIDFANIAGAYAGLLDEHATNFATSGFLSLRVSKTGVYHGNAIIGGVSQTIAGQFDRFGYAPLVLRRATLSGSLQIENDGDFMTGALTDGRASPALLLYRAMDATNANVFAGDYSLTFGPDETVTTPGLAKLHLTAKGAARMRGRLGDGTPFAQRSFLPVGARFPLFVPLYHHRGVVMGWLDFRPDGTVQGTARWLRPGDSRSHDFPDGFVLELPVRGMSENQTQSQRAGFFRMEEDAICRPRLSLAAVLKNSTVVSRGSPSE